MNAINLYECYEHGEYSFTLRDRFIHSPQVERALTRLGDIHGDSRRTRASKGLLIQGPSGGQEHIGQGVHSVIGGIGEP